jgi:ABC-type Fe3+-hydroxamate transport system substrate-binding protein
VSTDPTNAAPSSTPPGGTPRGQGADIEQRQLTTIGRGDRSILDPAPPGAGRTLILALIGIVGLAMLSAFFSSTLRKSPTPPVSPPISTPISNTDVAPRLVVLSPALAVTARDLGLERFIVGRHAFDMVLDPALPVCGDQSGIDYEALLRAAPTHVLMQWGGRPIPDRLQSLARENNWTLTNINVLTLNDITTSAARIDNEIAAPLRERNAIQRDLGTRTIERLNTALTREFAEGAAPGGRVLLLGQTNPPAAMGPGSFHHEILVRIGGRPAITQGAAWISMDAEDVLRLQPDSIILVDPRARDAAPGDASPRVVKTRLGSVGELAIPAVLNERLALIDDPLSHMPSTAMTTFAEQLKKILERWQAN